MLQLKNVKKNYIVAGNPSTALSNISLTFKNSE